MVVRRASTRWVGNGGINPVLMAVEAEGVPGVAAAQIGFAEFDIYIVGTLRRAEGYGSVGIIVRILGRGDQVLFPVAPEGRRRGQGHGRPVDP